MQNPPPYLEPVPAIYAGNDHEVVQLQKELQERRQMVAAVNGITIDPTEPSEAVYRVREPFFLFAWRIPGANMSIPAVLMFLALLVMSILLAFSLINVWIPNSPTLWMPIMIWVITLVYFVFLIAAMITLPSIESIYTESWARLAKYHRNDIFHFWWGFLLYFFVSIFYMIWYVQSAGQSLPVDPLLDIVVFLGQQNLHLILLVGSITILFTQPFANNIMLTGTLLYRLNPLAYHHMAMMMASPPVMPESRPASSSPYYHTNMYYNNNNNNNTPRAAANKRMVTSHHK